MHATYTDVYCCLKFNGVLYNNFLLPFVGAHARYCEHL